MRVLDPACGSGNFLYLALNELKTLEWQIMIEGEALGFQRAFPTIGPEAVLGIELNPYAAELARISVWIGEIQWMLRNGFDINRAPVLRPLETIENKNALIDTDGSAARWPDAEIIVGNPPYMGAKLMNRRLGREMTQSIRRLYDGRLPAFTDLVCFWFENARSMIAEGRSQRAGLVATNSIRKNTNLNVMHRIVETTRIFAAWPEQRWDIEGAAVDVSLVCFGHYPTDAVVLDGEAVTEIHADLTAGLNLTLARPLAARMMQDIAELEEAQAKGRATSKAAIDRARSIESKRRRHAGLDTIQRFIYSPTGDNRTRDALNHAEVIAMTAEFLTSKPGLRRLLVTRFPILLIDESQDTSRRLMDALLEVQAAHRYDFILGLFGDTMQRIYADGKTGLAEPIPADWAKPRKEMNHRCPTRVIELINKVRRDDDGQEQRPRSDAQAGVARLFLLPHTTIDKSAAEASIAARMAEIAEDPAWADGSEAIKTLALEHMMSARRFGFEQFFEPLYAVQRINTGLLDGTGAGLGIFTREILPLVKALRAGDRFATAAIIRRTSPLLNRDALRDAGEAQQSLLDRAKAACAGLLALVDGQPPASLRDVLRYVAEHGLFTVPDVLLPFAAADPEPADEDDTGKDEEEVDIKSEIAAWRQALEAPFDQIDKYDRYVRGISQFDTHQGVKGLEFPRVMVVISDEEARGFLFNYDKLFGTKGKSKTDLENEAAGKETTIDRTRRLFYVTCSRAEQSLAVVYYAENPTASRDAMLQQGWFAEDEVEIVA